MNKLYALFPFNKRIGKEVKLGLLKAIGISLVSIIIVYIISVMTRGIPVVKNLTGNFYKLYEKYALIGMLVGVIQKLTGTDGEQIEFLTFDKIKQLIANDKKKISLIVIGVLVIGMCIVPAYHKPKKVENTTNVTADNSLDSGAESGETAVEAEVQAEESAMGPQSADEVAAVPDSMKDSQGYMDANGQIVYAEYMSDEDCWWAIRTYAKLDTKQPVYVRSSNGTIRYEVTWDFDQNHWHVVKNVDDEVVHDALYDDNLQMPLDNEIPYMNLADARAEAQDAFDNWGFPCEDVFKNYISLDKDEYGNEIRLLENYNKFNDTSRYCVGVRVADMAHVPTTYTVPAENLASDLNKGDVLPVTTLLSYTGDETNITIPNHILRIEDEAFIYNSNKEAIEQVIIPDSVTSIGRSAFKGCTNLSSVTFGKHVYEIERDAFSDCNIAELTLPNSISMVEALSVQFAKVGAITWNGTTYTNLEEFEEALIESGGAIKSSVRRENE